MTKLKMAVVGAGFWGRNHVRVLNELPEVEMVSVCDVDKQRAETVSKNYGLNAYASSREMYKREKAFG